MKSKLETINSSKQFIQQSDITARSINSINEVWRIEASSPFLKFQDNHTLFSGAQRATYVNNENG